MGEHYKFCSCLPVQPCPARVLLSYVLQTFFYSSVNFYIVIIDIEKPAAEKSRTSRILFHMGLALLEVRHLCNKIEVL